MITVKFIIRSFSSSVYAGRRCAVPLELRSRDAFPSESPAGAETSGRARDCAAGTGSAVPGTSGRGKNAGPSLRILRMDMQIM